MKHWLCVMAAAALTACGAAETNPGKQGQTAEVANAPATPEGHGTMSGTLDPAKPDRSFAEQMIPHHQGAVEMAQQELALGKDPEMRQLATKIIADQRREIAQLEAWLAKSANQ